MRAGDAAARHHAEGGFLMAASGGNWKRPLKITESIFDELSADDDGENFVRKVKTHYEWVCRHAACVPSFYKTPGGEARFGEARLKDAHFAFREDWLKHQEWVAICAEASAAPDGAVAPFLADQPENTNGMADYFKWSASLAFWLRRFSPVITARNDRSGGQGGDDGFAAVLKESPSELLAFDLGLTICESFRSSHEGRSEPSSQKASRQYRCDIRRVCRTLRYKNVSPHSLELMYRSLYSTPEKLLYPGCPDAGGEGAVLGDEFAW